MLSVNRLCIKHQGCYQYSRLEAPGFSWASPCGRAQCRTLWGVQCWARCRLHPWDHSRLAERRQNDRVLMRGPGSVLEMMGGLNLPQLCQKGFQIKRGLWKGPTVVGTEQQEGSSHAQRLMVCAEKAGSPFCWSLDQTQARREGGRTFCTGLEAVQLPLCEMHQL